MNLDKQTESLDKYTRLTNYLSAAQIFLKDNFFLEKKLETKDIKERLLGHWGTCPGINIVYAHTNRLIKNNKDRDFMFVVGPGHGFPAYQSNIFLDGSLSHFYPEKNPFNKKGLVEMIEHFSTPYGHPSHLNPEAPGAVVEGGELGYSLSISSGTVLDNPNLITVCVIGDGEAETGTLASSWHINKFISPKTDGMVLPVLHLNGYKISGPTIFGRMSDHDITKYFEGLGYEVLFIKGESLIDVHKNASLIFDSAISKIINIQNKTRNDNSTSSLQNWPIIILKTEKGMTSVDYINNKKISGNCHSHQIVFDNPKKNQSELVSLESWLRSYHVEELISFDESGKIILDKDIVSLIPELNRSLGFSPYARASNLKEVKLPLFEDIYTDQEYIKEIGFDAMTEAGDYMSNVISLGNDMRLFSPDETYSNKLNNIFKSTKRVWQLPIKEWDEEFSDTGRVVEMLSENVLFGMMWGYTLSGRFGYFATYEAFAEIVASMADQYVKFIKVARDIPWRNKVPAMNVILSSLLERQDHNGFSHQNPSFISNTILRDRDITSVYMPADKNLMKLALEKTMKSKNALNIIVCGKKMTRVWLSKEEAIQQSKDGIMIWNRFSDENPEVVIVTSGDYVTEESISGMYIIKDFFPNIPIRFVNVFTLDVFDEESSTFSKKEIIDNFLTQDKGVVFNFHGYPDTIKHLLFEYNISDRIIIKGYEENGSTTSPFDMKARNGLSRFHLVMDVATILEKQKNITKEKKDEVFEFCLNKLKQEKDYILENGDDPSWIKNWEK